MSFNTLPLALFAVSILSLLIFLYNALHYIRFTYKIHFNTSNTGYEEKRQGYYLHNLRLPFLILCVFSLWLVIYFRPLPLSKIANIEDLSTSTKLCLQGCLNNNEYENIDNPEQIKDVVALLNSYKYRRTLYPRNCGTGEFLRFSTFSTPSIVVWDYGYIDFSDKNYKILSPNKDELYNKLGVFIP